MPIYTYECEAGHHFEVAQKVGDEPEEWCTVWQYGPYGEHNDEHQCASPCRRILVPGTGVVLKGKGWAKDGYS